jgi:hypothetical protein
MAQDRDKWKALVSGNEPSVSIKGKELLEWLHSWWPF